MNALSTINYRERLLKRRSEILGTVDHLQKEKSEVTGQRHFDWVDQSWEEEEIKLLERLSEGYRSELESIDKALNRIEAGMYGVCVACHQPIAKPRLAAFPAAGFCHDCQDMRERLARAA